MERNEKIKQARKKLKLTQQKLADMLGVTRQAVYYWERGLREPDIFFGERLARTLHLELDDVLSQDQIKLYNHKITLENAILFYDIDWERLESDFDMLKYSVDIWEDEKTGAVLGCTFTSNAKGIGRTFTLTFNQVERLVAKMYDRLEEELEKLLIEESVLVTPIEETDNEGTPWQDIARQKGK